MKLTRLQADGLLFITTIFWGSAFVAQKLGNAALDPAMFVGLRFMLAAVIMLPLAWREKRKAEKRQAPRWLYIAAGLSLGIANIMQQYGLTMTSATNSGFITSLYMAMVPFAAWLINKTPIRPLPTLAAVIAMIGAWLLSTNGQSVTLNRGDVITVISDIGWALQIIFMARAAKMEQRPFLMAFVQYTVTGVLGIGCGLIGKPLTTPDLITALPPLLYACIIPSCIGFTLPCFALRYTPEAEGAVIMSLEGVVCAIAGAIFLGDRLTQPGFLGCGLILLGVLMVELSPLLKRSKAAD